MSQTNWQDGEADRRGDDRERRIERIESRLSRVERHLGQFHFRLP